MKRLIVSCILLVGGFLQAWAGPSCALNPKNQTVTICTPIAGATGLSSPVHVNAGTTDTHRVLTMWIYVDGIKVFFQNNVNFIDTNITLKPGTHRLSVPAKDTTGLIFRTVENITVVAGAPVTVSPSAVTLLEGAQQTFTANVPVTWSASCGTINSAGLYTAPNQVESCTVKATASDGSGNTGTATVTVVAGAPVTVTPSAVTLLEGAQQAFTANVPVSWSASCGTINSAGLYTAPNQAESCTVKATASDGSGHSGTATVTVVALMVSPAAVTLLEGAQQQFTANTTVTWSASCGAIDASGLYTAPNQTGLCTVTATDGLGGKGIASVTVIALTVSPNSVTLAEGAQQQFTANGPVAWSASCGTITSNGLYTAPNVVGPCTITATDGTGHRATATVTVVASQAVTGYLTWKNDNARTGQQRNETILTPANVNSAHFGKKFSESVDGYVFAQPLYVANLTVNGSSHNVVFVVTEHDSVYAFDADSGGAALWQKSFLSPGVTTVPSANVGSTILPEVGITSTPVIDPNTNTIYVVAETLENSGNSYVFRIHAMDLATGAEKSNSPQVISASGFQPKEQLQRTALLLANGLVYFGFGSQGDHLPYQGWIFAVDPSSLQLAAVWSTAPTGTMAGIWMAGSGPATDSAGNLYVMVGNGTWNPASGDYGDSFVKLNSGLSVVDYFTPFDQAVDNIGDLDVGSGGPLIVPDQSGAHPHELIACGKPKYVYVIDRDNMGQFQAGSDSQIIQSLPNVVGAVSTGGFDPGDHCFMTPAFWEQNLYFAGNHDVIKAFHLDPATGLLSTSPTSTGSFFYEFPGGQPVVSSNGSTNGIVWVVDFSASSSSALHAYDATNVANELYNSNQVPSRDSLGTGSKFATPTVINGKVYVGSKGHLTVYGPM